MKKCRYCGAEYQDDVSVCPVDLEPLDGTQPTELTSSPGVGFGIQVQVALRLVIVFAAYLLILVLVDYLPVPALPPYFASLSGLCLFFVLPFAGYYWVLGRTATFRSTKHVGRILALMGLSTLLALSSFIGAAAFLFIMFSERH